MSITFGEAVISPAQIQKLEAAEAIFNRQVQAAVSLAEEAIGLSISEIQYDRVTRKVSVTFGMPRAKP